MSEPPPPPPRTVTTLQARKKVTAPAPTTPILPPPAAPPKEELAEEDENVPDEEMEEEERELTAEEKARGTLENTYKRLLRRYQDLPEHEFDELKRARELRAVLLPERQTELKSMLKKIETSTIEQLLPGVATKPQSATPPKSPTPLSEEERSRLPVYQGLSRAQRDQMDAAFDLLQEFVDRELDRNSAEYKLATGKVQEAFFALPAKNMTMQLGDIVRNELNDIRSLEDELQEQEEQEDFINDIKEIAEEPKTEVVDLTESSDVSESESEEISSTSEEEEDLETQLDTRKRLLDYLSRFFRKTYPNEYRELYTELEKQSIEDLYEELPIVKPVAEAAATAAIGVSQTPSPVVVKPKTLTTTTTTSKTPIAEKKPPQKQKAPPPISSIPAPPAKKAKTVRVEVQQLTEKEQKERERWIQDLKKKKLEDQYFDALHEEPPRDLFMVWVDQYNRLMPVQAFFKKQAEDFAAAQSSTSTSTTSTSSSTSTFAPAFPSAPAFPPAPALPRAAFSSTSMASLIAEQDRAFEESLAQDRAREQARAQAAREKAQQQQAAEQARAQQALSAKERKKVEQRVAASVSDASARRRCLKLISQLLSPIEILTLVERYAGDAQRFSQELRRRLTLGLQQSGGGGGGGAMQAQIRAFLDDSQCWSDSSLKYRYPDSLCDSELLLELFGVDLDLFAPDSPFLKAVYGALDPRVYSQPGPIATFLQSVQNDDSQLTGDRVRRAVNDQKSGLGLALQLLPSYQALLRELQRQNELKPAGSIGKVTQPELLPLVASIVVLRCLRHWNEVRQALQESDLSTEFFSSSTGSTSSSSSSSTGSFSTTATSTGSSSTSTGTSTTSAATTKRKRSSFEAQVAQTSSTPIPNETPQQILQRRRLEQTEQMLLQQQQELAALTGRSFSQLPPPPLFPAASAGAGAAAITRGRTVVLPEQPISLRTCQVAAISLGLDPQNVVEVDGLPMALFSEDELNQAARRTLQYQADMAQDEGRRPEDDFQYQSIKLQERLLRRCLAR